MYPSNREIAKLLRDVAVAMSIKDAVKLRFHILAYEHAAGAIETYPRQLADLYVAGELGDVPGIGTTIKEHLTELFTTGCVRHFEEITEGIPPSAFQLTNVPTIGPRRAYQLVSGFNLTNPNTIIDDVERLAKEGRIAALPGFGEKSQANILQAIADYRQQMGKSKRMTLPFAGEVARGLIDYLQQSRDILQAYPLGSLRRMKETIGDIDVAVAARKPEQAIDYFLAYPHRQRTMERGPVSASVLLTGGTQVDLMVQPTESFGSLLQHFTGSREHNIHLREYAQRKGLSLSEYGIKQESDKRVRMFAGEEDFYHALGMQWIDPELREDTGEIERAIEHRLPTLVTLGDIKGDLHVHSSYPIEPSHDLGADTMQAMVQRAQGLGYEYLGFSEHNPSRARHNAQDVYEILSRRREQIDKLQPRAGTLHVLSLLEVDILPDGDLAIDDKAVSILDAMVVSVHSAFRMSEEEMTQRVLRGLSHPKAKILGHPTGRLLNERPGYELDWGAIFDFAKVHGKALEVNSWPQRLDLPDAMVRSAIEHGVKIVINTDSHAVWQMDLMKYGVAVARRGWATRGDILNTLQYSEFWNWLTR